MESASAPATSLFERLASRISIRRDGWFVLVLAGLIVADQVSKWLIRTNLDRGESWPDGWHIRIVHYVNTGAAFGILQDSGPLLVITSFIGVAVLLVYLLNPGFAHPVLRLGLALMLAGAIGNLIDRLSRGEVVDFVKVPNFPAFNVADSAITIGVLCLLWAVLWTGNTEPEKSDSS